MYNLIQVYDECGEQALFSYPNNMEFNTAIDLINKALEEAQDEEYPLSSAQDWLEETHNIERVLLDEHYTSFNF